MTAPATIELANVRIHAIDLKGVLDRVDDFVRAGTPHYNVAINAAKIVDFQEDERLREAIRHAHLLTADGQPIVWAATLLGRPLPERVAGADLMEALLAHANQRGYSVYFLGARQEVVEKCVARATTLYPALRVAGFRDGYFDPSDEASVVEAVRACKPDLLFLGFGSPAKEYFMHRWHQQLSTPFIMGVGGTFDVFAGLVARAPVWMQRTGLEWAFRLAQEPRRMWKRYLRGNSRFIALVTRELLQQRLGKR